MILYQKNGWRCTEENNVYVIWRWSDDQQWEPVQVFGHWDRETAVEETIERAGI